MADEKNIQETEENKEDIIEIKRGLDDAKFNGEDEYNSEFGDEDEDEDSGSSKLIHLVFGALVILILGIAIFALYRWNKGIDLVINPEDLTENYDIESMAYYSHFDPNEVEGYVDDGELNILILGDDAMYYCDDENTSISHYIAEATGGNVVTLALPGQSISNSVKGYTLENPVDSYNLYFITQALCGGSEGDYSLQQASWQYMEGDTTAYVNYWDEAHDHDPNKYDIIIINIGTNDYLLDRPFKGDEIREGQIYGLGDGMAGALHGALEMFKLRFPSTQIIFSSPNFILTENKNGEIVGADTVRNSNGYYGDYISEMANLCMADCVTFVDNYLCDDFNPDNYEGKLEENGIYPNAEGRKIIADNIVSNIWFVRNNRNQ